MSTQLHGAGEALDLFAGPGGWDLAASTLGIEPLGIEWDEAACQTRAAAGLRTKQADVAELDPSDFAPCYLLIASPPCPTFSRAGKGDGIADMPLVYEAATAAARGKPVPPLPWRDDRSALVVEPLRWAVLLEPRFLAWEQVPDVLPFWQYCAALLRSKGWNVWTGVMEAERYGVPQTRKRAILMADREQPVHPARPTHQRYVKEEPQRHETTLDEGEVLPWVSMGEALAKGVGVLEHTQRNGSTGEYCKRAEDEPAFTLTTNSDRWIWHRPAPTIVTTRRSDKGIIVGRQLPEGEGRNVGGWGWNPRQNGGTVCDCREPAPTVLAEGLAKGVPVWDDDLGACPKAGPNAVRIGLEEAAVLQSFPPDYPFQGTKSKRFEQVGNAVPPLLARAILSALLGIPAEAHLHYEQRAAA